MKAVLSLPVLVFLLIGSPAAAQFGRVKPAPRTWASAWVGGYLSPGRVSDGASDSNWNFGSALAAGAGVHRQFGPGLLIGVDASFAPAGYERTHRDSSVVLDEGNGRLMSGMLSARLRYSGGESFGLYLTGGAGMFVYDLPSLDRRDPDLALLTGAGLEYRPSSDKALFVEWGRFWTFHQREGVSDNTAKHSQLRGGARFGW